MACDFLLFLLDGRLEGRQGSIPPGEVRAQRCDPLASSW